jgi:4-oxalocrotonate tautomerase
MPYVNVKVTPDGVTAERKRRIIAGITEVLQTVLGKDPAITMVVIDEVEADNWGLGGESVTTRRGREQRR